MVAITYIQLTREELANIAEQAATIAVQKQAKATGEVWSAKDVARHFGVTERTVSNWERSGRIPARKNGFWSRHQIITAYQDA